MARKLIELSGISGFVERHFGDINDTSSQNNLRYSSNENQFASGIYNPIRKYGYLSPANNTLTNVTGTLSGNVICSAYDYINDKLYLGTDTTDLLELSGLNDTTLTTLITYPTAVVGRKLIDMELYEMNGKRALYVLLDSTISGTGLSISTVELDANSGVVFLEAPVVLTKVPFVPTLISSGGNTRLAQRINGNDVVNSIDRIRVRLVNTGGGTTYTIRVGIQSDTAGAPSGTYLTSTTFSPTLLPLNNFTNGKDIYVDVSSVTLSSSTTYWLVIEPTNPGDLGGTNSFSWYISQAGSSLYPNGDGFKFTGSWSVVDSPSTSFDFSLIQKRTNLISLQFPTSQDGYNISEGQHSFFRKADNGFLYWFVENKVHYFDGGITGGTRGTFVENALVFPEYIRVTDAIDTNGYMFITLQSAKGSLGSTDNRTIPSDFIGVFIWDKRTTVAGNRDFIPLYDAKEIRNIFTTTNGEVIVLTIDNDRFCSIRKRVNNTFQTLERFEYNGHPLKIKSLSIINNFVCWLGVNGIIYAYGRVTSTGSDRLYKIGVVSDKASGTYSSGILISGNTNATPNLGMYLSWKDGTTNKLSKWYVNGSGTIDSNEQKPNQGDIFTSLISLSPDTNLGRILVSMIPNGSGGTDVVANLKIYLNQSTTPFKTQPVTLNDIKEGYIDIPINKPYTRFVQMEIEYITSKTLGVNDFHPMYMIIEYKLDGRTARQTRD
jgi:hypothetical protein